MKFKFVVPTIALLLALLPSAARASGELIVTELMYDAPGSDVGAEWVELYNASAGPITIVPGTGAGSWRINDGSNHVIRIAQGDPVVPPGSLFIIAASSSAFLAAHPNYVGTLATSSLALPNGGGTVGITADGGATWLAQVTYASSWGGAGDGSSLEKATPEGPDDAANWRSSPQPGGTPGQLPSPEAPNGPPVAAFTSGLFTQVGVPVQFDATASSDPDGDQLTYSWDFRDGAVASGAIAVHAFALAGRYDVLLTVSDGHLQATATASVVVFNEVSDDPQDPVLGTPPVPLIDGPTAGVAGELLTYSGSRSYDEDTPIVTYVWDFGDGGTATGVTATHAFTASGEYTVTLVVSDGSATSSASTTVGIAAGEEDSSPPAVGGNPGSGASAEGQVVITELLPNPVGDDLQGEYIEVQNVGADPVRLGPWTLVDGRGRRYAFSGNGSTDVALEPGSFLVVPRVVSGITLANASGSVQLLRWDGAPAGVPVAYGSSREGKAWSLMPDATWAWATPTPGSPNAAPAVATEKAATVREVRDAAPKVKGAATATLEFIPPPVATEDITDGDGLVEMVGVVTMPPGVAGKRLLYLADYDVHAGAADASAGIGVYFTAEAPPKLALGDIVTVRGKVGVTAGEQQLKVGRDGSVAIIGRAAGVQPEPVEVGALNVEAVGSVVAIQGSVAKASGKMVTLDDGTGQVVVWFPSSGAVAKPPLKQGQQLAVAGVVRLASDGSVRVMPRDAAEVAVQTAGGDAPPDGSVPASSSRTAPSGSVFRILGSGGSPLVPIGLAATGVGLAGAIWWVRRGS